MENQLTKKESNYLVALVSGEVRNAYTGSGRFTKKGADCAGQAAAVLEALGMKNGIHFSHGNDAPKGGWSGEFCTLHSKGGRWKIFDQLKIDAAERRVACIRESDAKNARWAKNEDDREVRLARMAEDPAGTRQRMAEINAILAEKNESGYGNKISGNQRKRWNKKHGECRRALEIAEGK